MPPSRRSAPDAPRPRPGRFRGIPIRLWHLRNWGRAHRLLTRPASTLRFVLFDRELDNFTYDLANADELAAFVAGELGRPVSEIRGYVDEVRNDSALREELGRSAAKRTDRRPGLRFGRRAGWYCILRARKPRWVIETGTHDGLGTTLLARALERNREEGHQGDLLTFDLDPASGWIVPEPLRANVSFVRGDIKATLPRELARIPKRDGVGVFLHDSDHSYAHETFEFENALPHLSPDGLLLSDNAHACEALKDFSLAHGLRFSFWKEAPRRHPYPGAGIGLAVPQAAPAPATPAHASRARSTSPGKALPERSKPRAE